MFDILEHFCISGKSNQLKVVLNNNFDQQLTIIDDCEFMKSCMKISLLVNNARKECF